MGNGKHLLSRSQKKEATELHRDREGLAEHVGHDPKAAESR